MSGETEWRGRGKVRARRCADGAIEVAIDGITTQSKYYKPLVYEFFRREAWLRPAFGDFHVSIVMEHVGEAPRMDLDNLAKALCDALCGFAYVDDSQIARLLVERRQGERERIVVRAERVG